MDEVTFGFILYIQSLQYNTEVEQRETADAQRLQIACLFIWVNLFCVSESMTDWMKKLTAHVLMSI